MADKDIYCCSDKVPCNSYKNDGLVSFKHMKSKKGEILLGYRTAAVCWIFLLSGRLSVSGEREDVIIEAGEMFLIPSVHYMVEGLTEVEFVYYTSDQPTEYCTQMICDLATGLEKEVVGVVVLSIHEPLIQFLNLVKLYLKSGLNCGHLFDEKQQELFVLLNTYYPKAELAAFLHLLTQRKDTDLRKYITENCSKAKNVQDLARICGYSVGGFKRLFKEIFNEPIYQWMLQQKSVRLRNILAQDKVNLKVIIDEFGFSSPAHFTKFCKQWLGMVPTKFMEEMRSQRGLLE